MDFLRKAVLHEKSIGNTMSDKKTRRVGIVMRPIGPTQAELSKHIQEYLTNAEKNKPRQPQYRMFKFPDNPDDLIITNPKEHDD